MHGDRDRDRDRTARGSGSSGSGNPRRGEGGSGSSRSSGGQYETRPLARIDVGAVRRAVRDLVDRCLSDRPPADFGRGSFGAGAGAGRAGGSLAPRRVLARRLLEPYVVEAFHMSVARAVRSIVRRHDGTPRGAVEACIVDRDAAGRRRFALASAGQGAYGKVYRLDKNRAAKLVLIEGRGFEREAALAKRAAEIGVGPAFHSVVSCCSADTGVCYAILITDALDITLDDWLRTPAANSIAEREKMRDALDAKLRRMHRAGLFHTDLHAANIMIKTSTGEPFIIDWGLAVEGTAESHNDRRILREIAPDRPAGSAAGHQRHHGRRNSARDGSRTSFGYTSDRDAEEIRDLVEYVTRHLATRVLAVS